MKNYIMCIGVGEYENQSGELISLGRVPVNDCNQLLNVLQGECYGFLTVQDPLFDSGATCNDITTAFESLHELEEESQLLILFSGHGHYDLESNMSYWLAHDAVPPSEYNRKLVPEDQGWVPASYIVSKVNVAGSRHVLILADCCFAGHMLYNFRGIGTSLYPDYAKLAIQRKSREILTSCSVTPVLSVVGESGVSKFIELVSKKLEARNPYDIICPQELFAGLLGARSEMPLYGHLQDGSEHGGCFLFASGEQLEEMEEEQFEDQNLVHHVVCNKLKDKLQPLNFNVDRGRYLKDFVGRQWIFDEISEWINKGSSALFWLTGEPGVGKSAVAAYLAEHHALVQAHHFFLFDKVSTLDLKEVAKTVAYQLSCVIPQYAEYVDGLDEERLVELDGQALFDELIIRPLTGIVSKPAAPIIILLDGVDESSQRRNLVAEYVAKLLNSGSNWLRIILTSRSRESQINTPLSKFEPTVLDANDPRNIEDITSYLYQHLPKQLLQERIIASIIEKSEGNFLYVVHLCDGLLTDEDILDIDTLPRGLHGLYELFFHRQFPDIGDYDENVVPFLNLLVAAYEPLSVEEYCYYLGERMRNLRVLLKRFGSLLKPELNGAVFFHKSLHDWVTSSSDSDFYISLEDARDQAAGSLWNSYSNPEQRLSDYELSYLVSHLSESRMSGKVLQVVCNLDYLQAKGFYKGVRPIIPDLDIALHVPSAKTGHKAVIRHLKEGLKKNYWFLQKRPASLISCLLNYFKFIADDEGYSEALDLLNADEYAWIESSHQKADEVSSTIFFSKEGEIRSCYPDPENDRIIIVLEEGLVIVDLKTKEWVDFVIEPDMDPLPGVSEELEWMRNLSELDESDYVEHLNSLTDWDGDRKNHDESEDEEDEYFDGWFEDDEYVLPRIAVDNGCPDRIYCIVWVELWRIDVVQKEKTRITLTSPAFTLLSHPSIEWLVIGCMDGHLSLLNYQSGKEEKRVHAHDCGISNVIFLAEAQLIATAGADGSIRLWEPKGFTCVRKMSGRHGAPICRLAPYGDQLFSIDENCQSYFWNVSSGTCKGYLGSDSSNSAKILSISSVGKEGGVLESEGDFDSADIAISEVPTSVSVRGNYEIILTYPSGRIHVWRDEYLAINRKVSGEKLVHASVLDQTGELVLGSVKKIDVLPFARIEDWQPDVSENVLDVIFSENADEFLLTTETSIFLYSYQTLDCLLEISLSGKPSQTFIKTNANCIISMEEMGIEGEDLDDEYSFINPFELKYVWKLHFWDKNNGDTIREYEQAVVSSGKIFEGSCILFVHEARLILYDLERREELFTKAIENARCAVLSPDGARVLVGMEDQSVHIFTREAFDLIITLVPEDDMFGFPVDIYDMLVSEDGRYVFVEYKNMIPGSTMIYNVIYDLEKGHAVFLAAGEIPREINLESPPDEWTGVFPRINSQSIIWEIEKKKLTEVPSSMGDQDGEYDVKMNRGVLEVYNKKCELLDALPLEGSKVIKSPGVSEWIIFGSGGQPFTRVKLANETKFERRSSFSLNSFFDEMGRRGKVVSDRSWDHFCVLLSGSSDDEQEDALKTLAHNETVVSGDNLLRLYGLKAGHGHKMSGIEELILEKGDASLTELYCDIMLGNMEDGISSYVEHFLRKICTVSDDASKAEVIKFMMEEGAYEALVESLPFVAAAGFKSEAASIVEWCLSSDRYLREGLLGAGLLPEFEEKRICSFLNHQNLQLRAASLRALEARHRDGSYLDKIKAGFSLIVNNFEGDQIAWDALEFLDGIIEFGDRERAITALKLLYDLIIDQHVFPKRAAWERLRVFGEEPFHEVFSNCEKIRPHPWPTKDAPFFGMLGAEK